jgi:hypothetical protein
MRGYDPYFFLSATWEDAAETLRAEADELHVIDAASSTEDEFDERASDAAGELLLPFEFGVSGAALALCAAQCPTFSCCRGHHDGSGTSDHPWIRFGADCERARLVARVAEDTGCALEHQTERDLGVFASSIAETISFGRALVMLRDQFDRLPAIFDRQLLLAALTEEHGIDED